MFEGSNRSVDVCLTKSASFSGNISLFFFTEQGSASGRQHTLVVHNTYLSVLLQSLLLRIIFHIYITAGLDYLPVNEELHFEPEELRMCLPITIMDDGVVEETENLFVLVEAQLVLDTTSVATSITEVCIIDDDGKEWART